MRLRRILGRGLAPPGFQGIRSRLGVAMAVALLPIILLSVIQTNATFRDQEDARRVALQLAAERSAAAAQARLSSTAVVLRVIAPDATGPGCEERLTALTRDLEGYDALSRRDGNGRLVCASRRPASVAPPPETLNGTPWFERLRAGERIVMARGMDVRGREPGLAAAIRLERPAGGFDGALAARVPLSILQPDVTDPALPEGSQAALTDGAGKLLIATDTAAFRFEDGQSLEGWVDRARAGSAVFEARTASGRRVYAGAALAGRDVYVLFSAPAPGLLSWARLNPMSTLLLPLGAWLTAFAAVMLLSERIVIRWLDYLERVAAIYARGRFTVRPVQAVNAPSEIRLLGRTLDDLAEAITVRDRSLTNSLAEKDALMREIHHRVKNNLQIISSLLSMQQRALKDEPAKAALGDTRQRISALALIYRTLYQGEDIHRADARDFLNDLVGQMVAGESGRGPLVTSSVEADSLIVDPDKLAPLALWLVEAVSNAQKHAFIGRGGSLRVRFKVGGDTSVLEVEDDGPGVSDTLRAGVGRTLMGAFAKQLRGEAELVPAPTGGTIARMTFPTPEALTPVDPNDLGTGAVRSR
ncbi:MAG TPA: sensor histidine kinase [Brevundimonas sp.]